MDSKCTDARLLYFMVYSLGKLNYPGRDVRNVVYLFIIQGSLIKVSFCHICVLVPPHPPPLLNRERMVVVRRAGRHSKDINDTLLEHS